MKICCDNKTTIYICLKHTFNFLLIWYLSPKENSEGYQKTSALKRAKNLKGNLLIISGSADDNVHPQNTLEFTEELVQNNIDFDMLYYTNRNHFINGGNTSKHLYKQMVRFLDRNLKN